MDPIALAMKVATLAGVAVSAVGLASLRLGRGPRARCAALGVAGLALMLANAAIAAEPWAPLLDGAYAAGAGLVLRSGVGAARHGAAPADG